MKKTKANGMAMTGFVAVAFLTLLLSTESSFAAKKKMTYSQAKAECLKENPSSAGKQLQACIKKKRR